MLSAVMVKLMLRLIKIGAVGAEAASVHSSVPSGPKIHGRRHDRQIIDGVIIAIDGRWIARVINQHRGQRDLDQHRHRRPGFARDPYKLFSSN